MSYNTVAGVLSQLEDDGWNVAYQRYESNGSKPTTPSQRKVIELTHPTKRGKITLVGPGEQILGPKAIASILMQAGIIPR